MATLSPIEPRNVGAYPPVTNVAVPPQQDIAPEIPVDAAPVVEIARNLSQPSPQNNIAVSKLINSKIEADKNGDAHVNTHTQWAPFIMSLLGGNLKEAYKYWNGGPTRMEEAYHPTYGRAFKEYNANGVTGRMFDANGKPLSPDQIAEIDRKGGMISKADLTAAQTGAFQAARSGAVETATGLRKPILEQYSKASSVATAASSLNNLLNERINIAKKSKWMDAISQLSKEQREKLFSVASQSLQESKGATTESTTREGTSVNLGTTEQKGSNVGAGIKAGIKPGTNAAGETGAGGGVGGNLSIGGSSGTGAQNQVGATTGVGAASGTTTSEAAQRQSNLRNQIESIIQGKLSDTDFSDLQRYLQLSTKIDEVQSQLNLQDLVPGAEPIPGVDPYLSGSKNSMITDLSAKKNVALTAAYESFLANKMHSSGGDYTDENIQKWREEFKKTNTYKGILYRFNSNIEEIKTNKAHQPKEGDIIVDNENRPEIRKNGRWEKLNVR